MFSKAAIGSIHKHDLTKCTQHTNTIEFRKKEMKSRELRAGWGFFLHDVILVLCWTISIQCFYPLFKKTPMGWITTWHHVKGVEKTKFKKKEWKKRMIATHANWKTSSRLMRATLTRLSRARAVPRLILFSPSFILMWTVNKKKIIWKNKFETSLIWILKWASSSAGS
jgi:hypothetical protein